MSGFTKFVQPNLLLVLLCAGLKLSACVTAAQPGSSSEPGGTVPVPAGWFWMGADDGRLSNQPLHRVYLDAYNIHKTEVTNGQFAAFVENAAYEVEGWPAASGAEDRDRPATGVLWEDAAAYCRWAGMRLPSEAEWEKTARGTALSGGGEYGLKYPWGNEWDVSKVNTAESGFGETLSVGSFPGGTSPYGTLDMAGNAAEWVADYFDFRYYLNSPEYNPTGPTAVMDHGLRGGSFDSPSEYATTYFRDSSHSARPNNRVGFRCVGGE